MIQSRWHKTIMDEAIPHTAAMLDAYEEGGREGLRAYLDELPAAAVLEAPS